MISIMMRASVRALWLGSIVILASCANVTAYLDNDFPKIDYGSFKNTKDKKDVGVDVEFQRNGERLAKVEGNLRTIVIDTFKKSGMFSYVSSGQINVDASIKIVVNNVEGETKGAGATATGLTLGLAGSQTIDRYEIQATYKENDALVEVGNYRREIYTAFGVYEQPENMEVMKIRDAIDLMYEQIAMKVLFDLQSKGII